MLVYVYALTVPFHIVPFVPDCGGELIAADQYSTIESPGFMTNSSYNASQQCIWTISSRNEDGVTGDGSSIVVRFTELDLEAHGSCMYDFVELREGLFNVRRCVGDNVISETLIATNIFLNCCALRFKVASRSLKVNFEMYISDRKAANCIGKDFSASLCYSPRSTTTGTLLLDLPSPECSLLCELQKSTN